MSNVQEDTEALNKIDNESIEQINKAFLASTSSTKEVDQFDEGHHSSASPPPFDTFHNDNDKTFDIDISEKMLATLSLDAVMSDEVKIKKLEKILAIEQEKYLKLHADFQESEKQRLQLISQNNKEIFVVNTQYAKLRSEFEKNEAIRQTLEFELSLAKTSFNKDRQLAIDKEKTLEEITKNFQNQLKIVKKENCDLKIKLKDVEIERLKEEAELQKIVSIKVEQEKIINSMKEEAALNKDVYEKLKAANEFFKEKEERLNKECENYQNKLLSLEEAMNKEKTGSAECKAIVELLQLKNKELEDKLKSNESHTIEVELNVEKLLDQLRENRKEAQEEQSKNKELKERYKLAESQLKLNNLELTKKLEEKNLTIKELSNQLRLHEINFEEIKNELKETKCKQTELDHVFNSSVKDIEQITSLFFTASSNDPHYEHLQQFQKQTSKKFDKNSPTPNSTFVHPTLAHSISNLKNYLQELKKFFIVKMNELNDYKLKIEKLNTTKDRNAKKMEEWENSKANIEKEIESLRNERQALEEVITSLRNECETLKTSLKKSYETNDNMNTQLNRINKESKLLEEQQLFLLQSLYKRLLPVAISSKSNQARMLTLPTDLKEEKVLEEFIDKTLKELMDRLSLVDEKMTSQVKELYDTKEQLQRCQKKYDEQINKLTKILKEKEVFYTKKNDSLVAYYEQLLNDVNSRVKQTQNTAGNAFDKLKDSTNLNKSLEIECNNLKETLKTSHLNQRNLKTSCLLLIGMLQFILKQNNDLKEQKNLTNLLSNKWLSLQTQLRLICDEMNRLEISKNVLKQSTQVRNNTRKSRTTSCDNLKSDNKEELIEAVDYSLSSSILSSTSSLKSDSFLSLTDSKKTMSNSNFTNSTRSFKSPSLLSTPPTKLCLFRHAAIAIMAMNRFLSLGKKKSICTNEPSLKFIIKNYEQNNAKDLFEWFTSPNENQQLNELLNVSCKLNSILFCDENKDEIKQKQKEESENNYSLYQIQQTILQCFNILTTSNKLQSMNKKKMLLHKRLASGLSKICKKNLAVSIYYSNEKKFEMLNKNLKSISKRQENIKQENGSIKKLMNEVKNNKELEKELSRLKLQLKEMVPSTKFDSLCHELENALKREQKAETLLKQQNYQIEEISNQLALISSSTPSNQDLELFKLNIINESNNRLNKKEKQLKQLQKKLSSLQLMKDNYEKSACSILLDKDLFLNYCQNIESLLQKSLQVLLSKDYISYQDVNGIVKQILSINLSSNYENLNQITIKLSPESLACQNLVNLFCTNLQMILTRIIQLEDEANNYLLRDNNTFNLSIKDKYGIIIENEFDDLSFKKLPGQTLIGEETKSKSKKSMMN